MTTPTLTLPGWRERLLALAEGPRAQRLIIALIVVNAVTLGLETSASVMAAIGPALKTVDAAILAVFVLEVGARLIGRGPAFFRDPWSVFDFLVVAIALVPASGPFAVLRALRILRVLRLFTMVPSMRRVVGALLAAIPGIGSIALIIGILFYVFAVIATNLFGAAFGDWFGTLGRSMYTLFQIMTLESWSMGIVRPVMERYPYAWLFFIPFILVATFTMLNLFIGVIVSAIQSQETALQEKTEVAVEHAAAMTHADVESLRAEIRELKALIQARDAGGGTTAS
ncbi:MAG TPA: ion transporter [Pelomicrobium sp.]|nr:ion transporter [Pelomicrobium sp.]